MTVAIAAPQITPAKVWWSAVRPATFAASVAPVLVGTALAVHQGGAVWWAGLLALIVGISIQLGVNFANDYSDHARGADKNRVGPVRAASSGVVAPGEVRSAAIAAFGVAAVAGAALSLAVDWRLLIVGAACVLAGWLYTGGPRPYGYLGLGELFVFIFFGLVATLGTVYVQTRHIDAMTVLMGCGVGFLATAILVLNNLRDMETDAAAGKHTLATMIGRRPTRILLVLLVAAAFTVPIVIFMTHLAPVTIMAMHFGIPIASVPVRTALATTAAPALIKALRRMAAAELAYALLFTIGILL
jgi:1,4-dihydroxy-2-naphthoate polyprenyltransferase